MLNKRKENLIMNKKRNITLDIIRIIAATLIVLHHYQQGTGIVLQHINFYGGKFNFGYVVELFFVISGLLVYKNLEDIRKNKTLKEFFGKKFFRIVPLLAISVIVEAFLRYWHVVVIKGEEFGYGLLDIIVNAFGLQQLGIFTVKAINQPTWYLSVLLLCYILFYYGVRISKRLEISCNYIFIAFAFCGAIIGTYQWNAVFVNVSIGRGLFSFFCGVILADFVKRHSEKSFERFILILPILFLVLIKWKTDFINSGTFLFYTIFLWLPIVYVSVKLVSLNIAENKIVSVLGASSFGVYVWNEPLCVVRNIVAAYLNIDMCNITAMIIFTILNWGVGVISYYLIEKTIDGYIKKLRGKYE